MASSLTILSPIKVVNRIISTKKELIVSVDVAARAIKSMNNNAPNVINLAGIYQDKTFSLGFSSMSINDFFCNDAINSFVCLNYRI